ncbi:MAG: hypothetical protein WBY53_04175 [Acidobacteriaceae bacterium]
MKTILAIFLGFAVWMPAVGQATNPQNTFDNAVDAASPSLLLNYNDANSSFKDQESGLTFGFNPPSSVNLPATFPTVTQASNVGQATFGSTELTAGTLSQVNLQTYTVPTAGQTFTVLIGCGTAPSSLTVTTSFTVNLAATKSEQSFTPPGGTTVGSNCYLGWWVPSGGGLGAAGISTGTNYWLSAASAIPTGAHSYGAGGGSVAMQAIITGLPTGTVTAQQPGFDSTNAGNYSAEFTYNAWSAAPNDTLGAIEWNVPWSMMIHVDRLNWDRTGALILASKGDVGCPALFGTCTSGAWWQLYLKMNATSPDISELCFTRNGFGSPNTAGGSGDVEQSVCTGPGFDAMPNGFNYDVVVTDSGSGSNGALSMYLNGLQVGGSSGVPGSNTGSNWFGEITVNASGGTGYANATALLVTGGGPDCVVTGNMNSSGGVPEISSGFSFTQNSGCTSIPTVSLVSPTGTGVTLTVGLGGQFMNNASYPVMAPGYVSGGVYYGIDSSDATQTPSYIDEFAEFPSALNFGQVSNIFYTTKFYQLVAKQVTTKPVLIFDDDSGGDSDNEFAFAMAIAGHKAGLWTLAGAVNENYSAGCVAMWRQMLDQAGLNHVPISVPAESPGTYACYPADVTAYNASTPQTISMYGSAAAMYRTIFAEYPSTPIIITSGGPINGLYDFMSSPADGVSSMTGLQLLAQDAANGGAAYFQGGGCGSSALPDTVPCSGGIGANGIDSAMGQYIVSNNGSFPLTWIGGTPMSAGPGALTTRTSLDPFYQFLSSFGGDVRQCYDCLTVEAAASSLFTNSVSIGYSGGTGYAAMTAFTLSGGGTNCKGSGFITASGGVPNGVAYSWGTSAYKSYGGLGSGCTSQPTVSLIGSTGTGGTFTAYPMLVCGTEAVTESGSTWSDAFSSATCSHHYTVPGDVNTNQSPISGALMTWFINSLVDGPPNGAPRTY